LKTLILVFFLQLDIDLSWWLLCMFFPL